MTSFWWWSTIETNFVPTAISQRGHKLINYNSKRLICGLYASKTSLNIFTTGETYLCDSLKGCCSKSTLCRVSLKDISLEMTKFRFQVIKTEKRKRKRKRFNLKVVVPSLDDCYMFISVTMSFQHVRKFFRKMVHSFNYANVYSGCLEREKTMSLL